MHATSLEDVIRFSPDYRSAWFNGETFPLTQQQAAVVRVLHENGLQGTPDVSGDYLLAEVESDAKRLRDLYRGSPAWRRLIVAGGTRGTYRLACFNEEKNF